MIYFAIVVIADIAKVNDKTYLNTTKATYKLSDTYIATRLAKVLDIYIVVDQIISEFD